MTSILSAKQIALQREQTIKYLLPDICQIYPQSATRTIDESGLATTTSPTPRTWRGSTNIQCRFDLSRAFRPGALEKQVATVDEYILELPWDIEFENSDRVHVNGYVFLMRKQKDLSQFDTTVEVVISRLGAPDVTV